MNKIETLGNLILESEDTLTGYAGAYGAMKTLAGMMFSKLSPEDQGFVDRVLDTVIEQETARKSA